MLDISLNYGADTASALGTLSLTFLTSFTGVNLRKTVPLLLIFSLHSGSEYVV